MTVAIADLDGQEVASQTYTPTVNIGNNTANKFSGVKQQTFEFDIAETGRYVIVFYTDAAKNADFVLGQASIQAKSFEPTAIREVQNEPSSPRPDAVYDLSGRRIKGDLKRGIYIIGGQKTVIR